MTISTPATKARRAKVIARCTCPTCMGGYYTSADGAFFCTVDREYTVFADGQYLGSFDGLTQATEALGVYRIDQALAQAVEAAAVEADLAHDVAQAAADADAVAAVSKWNQLGPAPHLFIPAALGQQTAEQHEAALVTIASLDDADICRLIAAMPPLPPPLYYDRHHRGLTWAGTAQHYPHYTAADAARTEWMRDE